MDRLVGGRNGVDLNSTCYALRCFGVPRGSGITLRSTSSAFFASDRTNPPSKMEEFGQFGEWFRWRKQTLGKVVFVNTS